MVIGTLSSVVNEGVLDAAKEKGKAAWNALTRKGDKDDTFGDDLMRRGTTKLGNKLKLGSEGKTNLGVAGHLASGVAKYSAGAIPGAMLGSRIGSIAGPAGTIIGGLVGAGAGGTLTSLKHNQNFGKKMGRAIVKGSGKGIFYNADKEKNKKK